ncbi:L,D-transpeptidase family protein [soil metagenome]
MIRISHIPAILALLCLSPALAQDSPTAPETDKMSSEEREKWTALQIFLDDAGFHPGKIDGRWGSFTARALERHQRAEGKSDATFGDEKPEDLPVDTDSVSPVFTTYTITEEDVDFIGSLPDEPVDQAKEERMPYTSLAELAAEKFHTDLDYFRELNEGVDIDALKTGDSVTVPNVGSVFSLADVKPEDGNDEDAEGDEGSAEGAEESGEDAEGSAEGAAGDEEAGEDAEGSAEGDEDKDLRIEISTTEKVLEVYAGDALAATYPVTPGSETLPAPKGEWEVTSVTWMPTFRWDKQMLEKGERSEEAHILPPGPNSPVGIVWIAIDKDGIGIHGTAAPDDIGRTSSHGCIRLSNWDAWDLGNRVAAGTPVIIRD